MKLASLFRYLRAQAHRTGRDQAADLFHGARIAVRVRDGDITLTISRADKKVGDIELNTFRVHCGVPATAIRWPAEGQHATDRDGTPCYLVAFRWMEVPGAEDATPGNDALVESLPASQ